MYINICVYEIASNSYLPSEQSKSPVSDAHSVPLLQLYFDLNMSGRTCEMETNK